ncbi:unnamed protein product [Didymodactylos carnosus]|uniref:Integrase catalytic domain-containing protein n=1 Tax=Didymodactylos carnosus TaxID=1234261 RepID=A0A8S2SVI9_9BILA|nr:unnamed protein product [Didymodactylos carnosus]CAF4252911.1 unnamed protein product [Didymodactylos carnosus]CAF4555603.1 unnamed protein product [Didymodactylos carnosus]
MCFVRGRPRHPQSQGCVERANGVLTGPLGKWMADEDSVRWSEGLLPVIYGINTRLASATKTTPYEVLFGQKPRSDVEFWRVVKEKNILDEDDLPGNVEEIDLDDELDTPVVNDAHEMLPINVDTTASLAMSLTSSVTDLDDGTTVVNLISFDSLKSPSRPSQDLSVVVDVAIPDTDIKTYDLLKELIALCDSVETTSQMTLSTPSVASNVSVASTINSIPSQSPRHDSIRRKATENYVATASKKRKIYDDDLTTLAEGLKLGDCVGIKIHEVDRTNTDPKILPCLIVWKEKKHEDYVFKIVCQFGKLDKGFGVESLIPHTSFLHLQCRRVFFHFYSPL